MILSVVISALLATAPAAPKPTHTEQAVRHAILAEPTKVYDLTEKKRK